MTSMQNPENVHSRRLMTARRDQEKGRAMNEKQRKGLVLFAVAFLAFVSSVVALVIFDNMLPALISYCLLIFYILAKSVDWKSLAVRASVMLVPLISLLALSLIEPDEGTIIVIVLIIPPSLGALARVLSLLAEKWGHSRPGSLWIEAIFFLLPVTYAILAVVS
jgi:hypothetical protein